MLARVTAAEDVRKTGVAIFDAAYPPDLLERIGTIALEQFGGLSENELEHRGLRVGDERYMFPMPIAGPVNDERIYAAPAVLGSATELLGTSVIIASFSVVIAYPGAAKQNVHRDHSYLFPDQPRLSQTLPPYALTVIVPLIGLEKRGGGTRVYDKSHDREPGIVSRFFERHVLNLPLGSAAMMEYRLAHRGTENSAAVPRPVLFIVYARRWFRDTENFERHAPLVMPSAEVERVPEARRDLLLLATRPHLK